MAATLCSAARRAIAASAVLLAAAIQPAMAGRVGGAAFAPRPTFVQPIRPPARIIQGHFGRGAFGQRPFQRFGDRRFNRRPFDTFGGGYVPWGTPYSLYAPPPAGGDNPQAGPGPFWPKPWWQAPVYGEPGYRANPLIIGIRPPGPEEWRAARRRGVAPWPKVTRHPL